MVRDGWPQGLPRQHLILEACKCESKINYGAIFSLVPYNSHNGNEHPSCPGKEQLLPAHSITSHSRFLFPFYQMETQVLEVELLGPAFPGCDHALCLFSSGSRCECICPGGFQGTACEVTYRKGNESTRVGWLNTPWKMSEKNKWP